MKVLKKVPDKKQRKEIKKRLEALPSTSERLWRNLTDWFGPTDQNLDLQLAYLANLYSLLLKGASLEEIGEERKAYASAFTMGGTTGQGKQESKGKEPEKEKEVEDRRSEKPRGRPVFGPGFSVEPSQLTSARTTLQRPASFSDFPANDQPFLLTVFDAYNKGRIADWGTLYEQYYKRSETKAALNNPPSPDDYVRLIRTADNLGGGPLPRAGAVRAQMNKATQPGSPRTPGEVESAALISHPDGYPIAEPTQGSIGCRVYLNVLPRCAPLVYGEVRQLPEVTWAKLGSHESATTVRDTIVLYTEDKPSAMQLCGRLLAFQQQPVGGGQGATKASFFVDEIVHFTQPIPGLPGVGVGEDLSPTRLTKAYGADLNLSFSQLRTMLVFKALTKSGNDQRRFEAELVRNFQAAEISPAQPWQEGNPDKLIAVLKDLLG
ncbi:hypothetical protein GCM10027569_65340 [Flindersiella endophytica]